MHITLICIQIELKKKNVDVSKSKTTKREQTSSLIIKYSFKNNNRKLIIFYTGNYFCSKILPKVKYENIYDI